MDAQVRRPTGTIWFTADTHLGHKKMAEHRGFGCPTRMTSAMIDAWNARVAPHDWVYVIGDFSFMRNAATIDVLQVLHGRIVLIPGNHDKNMNLEVKAHFFSVHAPLIDIKVARPDQEDRPVEERELVRLSLCHFPLLVWNMMHAGAIHLHGHSHGSLQHPAPGGRMMDVGVDTPLGKAAGYAPISLAEVMAEMEHRRFIGFDQHVPDLEAA
jgi:calcineurin-like phosphoesterase family protein